jgi:sulfite reductase (NADPH) flavoprotein alpha-component
MSIRVLFGTETGNAEECADDLGTALQDAGFPAVVIDLENFQPTELAQRGLVLMVTSTYGNGDPPYSAEALMKWLRLPESSISGVSFGVCGLGDRTYPLFAQAGKDFDRLMEERGGRRVIPRQDCDAEFEEAFEEFTERALTWIRANAAELDAAAAEAPAAAAPTPPPTTANPGTRGRPVPATLVSRRRLNRPGSAKETMHYEFRWPGVSVAFAPGDSFAVIPENNPAEVEAILQALSLDGATMVQAGDKPQSLRAVLTQSRDLHAVPADLWRTLAGPTQPGKDDWHLLDVAQAAPDAHISAQALVDHLRKLKPRLYSVASSPSLEPEGVHFTVETLRYTVNGRTGEGVATTWLADRVSDGDVVDMYCVQAPHFRLPQDNSVPIIMIGPGTGIAPFRAFLQQRKAHSASGNSWLFFGHQHQETDFLYEEELQGFLADGTLTELSLAWSRDQAEKIYVQDQIRARSSEVWAWLVAGAHVYVCGDKNSMAPQVRETFIDIGTTYGGMTREAAAALLDRWETSGRYCVDAY